MALCDAAAGGPAEAKAGHRRVSSSSTVSTACSEEAVRARPTPEQIKKGLLLPHLVEDATRRDDPAFKAVLQQAQALSQEHFHEDALAGVGGKGGWRVLLLCSEDRAQLWGFAVYKLKSQAGVLSLSKLAVPEACRGLGFGKVIVKELLRIGKAVPALSSVYLSSLPGAIKFYQRLGFKKHAAEAIPDSAEGVRYVEGQVFMELCFRKGSKGKKKR